MSPGVIGQLHSGTAPKSSKMWSLVGVSMKSMNPVSGRTPASSEAQGVFARASLTRVRAASIAGTTLDSEAPSIIFK